MQHPVRRRLDVCQQRPARHFEPPGSPRWSHSISPVSTHFNKTCHLLLPSLGAHHQSQTANYEVYPLLTELATAISTNAHSEHFSGSLATAPFLQRTHLRQPWYETVPRRSDESKRGLPFIRKLQIWSRESSFPGARSSGSAIVQLGSI